VFGRQWAIVNNSECDLVILSAMMVQKKDFHYLIRKAVDMGKKVAVGGPYSPTWL